jgi:hypothetical protein
MCDGNDNAERLAARKQVMEIIRRRRELESDMGIGASIERQILSQELAELEENRESFRPPSAAHR